MNGPPGPSAKLMLTAGMIASALVLAVLAGNFYRGGNAMLAGLLAFMACADAAVAAFFAWRFWIR
jgi:hypothetical protein